MVEKLAEKVLAAKATLKPEIKRIGPKNKFVDAYTYFNRHPYIISFLRKNIKSFPQKVDILDVGIGYDLGFSFEPITLAGICEMNGNDYSLTLLDNNEAVLNGLKKQKEIRIEDFELEALRSMSLWHDYSSRIGYLPPVTRKRGDEKIIYYRAKIPSSFKEKMREGQVKFALDDIRTMTPTNKYDLVYCMSLLEHIDSEAADACAVYNLVESTKKNGLLCVDGYEPNFERGTPTWGTRNLIKSMYGNSMENVFSKTFSKSSEMVFKKVKD